MYPTVVLYTLYLEKGLMMVCTVYIPSSVSMFNNSFFILKLNQRLAFCIYTIIQYTLAQKKKTECIKTHAQSPSTGGPKKQQQQKRTKTRNNFICLYFRHDFFINYIFAFHIFSIYKEFGQYCNHPKKVYLSVCLSIYLSVRRSLCRRVAKR